MSPRSHHSPVSAFMRWFGIEHVVVRASGAIQLLIRNRCISPLTVDFATGPWAGSSAGGGRCACESMPLPDLRMYEGNQRVVQTQMMPTNKRIASLRTGYSRLRPASSQTSCHVYDQRCPDWRCFAGSNAVSHKKTAAVAGTAFINGH